MAETNDQKRDDTLKRMLGTPPKPNQRRESEVARKAVVTHDDPDQSERFMQVAHSLSDGVAADNFANAIDKILPPRAVRQDVSGR